MQNLKEVTFYSFFWDTCCVSATSQWYDIHLTFEEKINDQKMVSADMVLNNWRGKALLLLSDWGGG